MLLPEHVFTVKTVCYVTNLLPARKAVCCCNIVGSVALVMMETSRVTVVSSTFYSPRVVGFTQIKCTPSELIC